MGEPKIIYFDLFFTLINPMYLEGKNENDVLHMTRDEWEQYAEDDILYHKRATGMILSEKEIINDIVQIIPMDVSEDQKEEIISLRKKRMKSALTRVDSDILQTLKNLQECGHRLCLISNADIIDAMYWRLWGAKELGMTTILTEYLDKKDIQKRKEILSYSDFCVEKFHDILGIIK